MAKLILLRFGELWLKSESVKKRFLTILQRNIRALLDASGIEHSFKASRTRFFIETKEYERAIPVLRRVFGISSFSLVTKTDVNGLEKEVLLLAGTFKKTDTFVVRAKREGTHSFTSQELERDLGALVVGKYGFKVNLTKSDNTIHVEVRNSDAYVYAEVIRGAGGLPLGCEGKVIGFLTRDKKSLAAVWLIMRRGARAMLVLSEKGAKKHIEVLRKFDPHIKIAEGTNLLEIAEDYGAAAVVVQEQLDDIGKYADAEKIRPLAVFRPLVGMNEKGVDEIFVRMQK
ncbi:MAG: hypothetical protein KAJ91_02710 [Candidatus Aenigmarchaeota archaeon]|nr:hypothetical protein [Candidatus Aenigmarchaeota archaeon]